MANITLAIDDYLLEKGREYAQSQNLSFNAFVRELVCDAVGLDSEASWTEDMFRAMDIAQGDSRGATWIRGDLYD
jgi:hypothetical protein